MEKQTTDFETLWQQAQSEPQVKKVQTPRVEVKLSIDDLMNRYMDAAREAVSQNKISKEALDEMSKHAGQFTTMLSNLEKAGVKSAVELQKRVKKSLLDRFT